MNLTKFFTFLSLIVIIAVTFIIININGSDQLYQNCMVGNCTYLSIEKGKYLILNYSVAICDSDFEYVNNYSLCFTNGWDNCPKFSFCYNVASQYMIVGLNLLIFTLFLVILLFYWFFVLRRDKEPEYLRIVD
jgi:hypothetical protein